jgi:hypothetical protein
MQKKEQQHRIQHSGKQVLTNSSIISKQAILGKKYALATTIVNPENSSPIKDRTTESVKPAANISRIDGNVVTFLTSM